MSKDQKKNFEINVETVENSETNLVNIPDKEERIKICTSNDCETCELNMVWCFDDEEGKQKYEQQCLFDNITILQP